MRRRGLIALAVAACLGGAIVVAPMATVASTQAAWTDRVHVSAPVAAGAWASAPITAGCVALDASGAPVPGATCSVTEVRFNQWSNGRDVIRDYYVSYTKSAGDSASIQIDLSQATGTGTWTWGKAVLLPTSQFTPVTGYACSELPVLRVAGPHGWANSATIWVSVLQDKATPMGSQSVCPA